MTDLDVLHDLDRQQDGDALEAAALFLLRHARRQDSTVLELACGSGRILVALAQAGVVITGVDASETLLTRIEDRLVDLPVSVQSNVSLVHHPLEELKLAHTFGLVYTTGGFFQTLTTVPQQEALIRTARRHLNKNGLFILETNDTDGRTVLLPPGARTARPISTDFRVSVDEVAQVVVSDRRFEHNGETVTVRETERYTHALEVQHLVRLCGFRLEAVVEDYDGTPYSTPGGRIIIVARRLD